MYARIHLLPTHPSKQSVRRSGRAASRRPGNRHRVRPCLEVFEDRCLLAAWTAVGPAPQVDPNGLFGWTGGTVAGRVTSLAVSSQGLLMGTAGGGIWLGSPITSPTWAPVTDNVAGAIDPSTGLRAGAIDIGTIAVDPNNPSVVYAGTGEANYSSDSRYGTGILKSTDGGNTWSLIATGGTIGGTNFPSAFFKKSISKIIVDPTNSSNIYAAVVDDGNGTYGTAGNGGASLDADGIWKSTNGGATWSRMIGSPSGGTVLVSDLDYTYNSSTGSFRIFAAVTNGGGYFSQAGVYLSDNGAASFSPNNLLPVDGNSLGRITLAADHTSGSQTIYAAVDRREHSIFLQPPASRLN